MHLSDDPRIVASFGGDDLAAIFDAIEEAIVQIDAQWRVLYANDVYLRFARMARKEVIGRTPFEFAPAFKKSIFFEPIQRCQIQRIETRRVSFSPVLSTWVRVRVVPYLNGSVLMISRASEDSVKDHLRAERAVKDDLTGLGNRLALEDRVSFLLMRHAPFAFALIGWCDSNRVRDAHGYATADLVILQLASRLSSEIQEGETVARIATDEFAVCLFGRPEELPRRVEGLLAASCRPIDLPSAPIVIRSAAGWVAEAGDARDFESLLRRGSLALAAARDHGAQGAGDPPAICAYQPHLELAAQARNALLDDLRVTLDGQQFQLHLQPKVSLVSGRVIGAEALLRWAHPKRGLLVPGHFLSALRELGALTALDRWAVHAAGQLAGALGEGGRAMPIAVNLGAASISDRTLPERCRLVLESLGVAPSLLEIEIPEGALVEDLQVSTVVLQQLHEMGVRLSIDDFGTGYSSFAYLARFPVQTLKIDRSLVVDLEASKTNRKIVQGIVKLAHHLGMGVVAEGVETVAQVDLLKRMQCDAVQGHVFARAMPLDAFVSFVDEHPGAALPDPNSI